VSRLEVIRAAAIALVVAAAAVALGMVGWPPL